MIECARRSSHNVRRWHNDELGLRWTAAGILDQLEAAQVDRDLDPWFAEADAGRRAPDAGRRTP